MSLTRRKTLLLVGAAVFFANQAKSQIVQFSGASGWAAVDGSLNAPVGGSFQQSNFFTSYAKQYGQTYAALPPWSVAGVNYAIGFASAALPLQDPSSATLPAGATYASNVVTVQSSSANIQFSGFDFSLHGGINVNFLSTYTGTCTFLNCKFKPGTTNIVANTSYVDCNTQSALANSYSLIFKNCDIDGDSHNASLISTLNGGEFLFCRYWGTGSVTFQYCAVRRVWGRWVVHNSTGNLVSQWNYFEDCNYNTADHGEWISTDPQNGNTCALVQFSYCCFLTPQASGGGMTCSLYASGGVASTGVVTTFQVDHCTFVLNPYGFSGGISGTTLTIDSSFSAPLGQPVASGEKLYAASNFGGTEYTIGTQISGSPTGQAGTYNISPSGSVTDGTTLYISTQNVAAVEYANVQITNAVHNYNFIDPTGASNGFVEVLAPTSTQWSGPNINMLTGAAINTYGQINASWG